MLGYSNEGKRMSLSLWTLYYATYKIITIIFIDLNFPKKVDYLYCDVIYASIKNNVPTWNFNCKVYYKYTYKKIKICLLYFLLIIIYL